MEYHGINMKGPFITQRVSSLPAWTSDDTGREVYLTTDNKRYCANETGWAESDINNIWVYRDTAPTGWSIVSGTTDALLACKGGSLTYDTTGGSQVGTWTQPNHTLTTDEIPPHTHTGAQRSASKTGQGGTAEYDAKSVTATGSAGGGSAHNHGNEYRPTANVGIVVERDSI